MARGVSHYTTGTLSEHRTRGLLSGVQIKYEGDWLKAKLLLSSLPLNIRKSALKAQLSFARKYKNQLQENIKNNGSNLHWAPLKKSYVKWKDKQNAPFSSASMYRFHGTYYNAIEIITSKDVVTIGISKDRDLISPHSKLRVSQYALILEMGSYSRGIPSRRLWGPSFAQIGGRREILRMLRNELQLSVKAYGIVLS